MAIVHILYICSAICYVWLLKAKKGLLVDFFAIMFANSIKTSNFAVDFKTTSCRIALQRAKNKRILVLFARKSKFKKRNNYFKHFIVHSHIVVTIVPPLKYTYVQHHRTQRNARRATA